MSAITNVSPIHLRNASSCETHASSIINGLPIEVLQLIASFVHDPKDIGRLALAHRQLSLLFSDGDIWDLFLRKDFPDSYATVPSKAKTPALYRQLANEAHHFETKQYRLQTLYGHREGVTSVLIHGDRLISSSVDKTMKVWDLETKQVLKTFHGHQFSVNCTAIYGDQLISGSMDDTIKIWDLNTEKVLKTLSGHEGQVTSITIHKDQLISSSSDRTIKIWDLNTKGLVTTLDEHQDHIDCVIVYDGKLISGSWDKTIKIWDLKTRQLEKSLEGHLDWVTCIMVYEGKLISGSWDTTIRIWDFKTGKVLETLHGHQKVVNGISAYNHTLFSCSRDATIKIWNLKTGKLIQSIKEHEAEVARVQFFEGKIITSSMDHTIKILDFTSWDVSPYSKQVLEGNLEILGKMAHAEYTQQPKIVKELAGKLHSDFKRLLRQHSFKVGQHFSCSGQVILRVQTEVCVEALLYAIHDKNDHRISQLIKQLIWIDRRNTQVFKLLWEICGRPIFHRWGEYAFYGQKGCAASSIQKRQAVIEFKKVLKKRWEEEPPLLLAGLGIVTQEEFVKKLKCTPDWLPEIGIFSPADLQAVFDSPHFQSLQIIPEEATDNDVNLQKRAFEKKTIVSTVLDKLSTAAEKSLEQIKQWSMFSNEEDVYEIESLWSLFQRELNHYQDILTEQCNTDEALLEKCHPESYVKVVQEINVWIDQFRSLKHRTQIPSLYAYANQSDIDKAWNRLHSHGIDSLAALLEQREIAPRDIFHMRKY